MLDFIGGHEINATMSQAADSEPPFAGRTVALIAAHPDDEVIGAGAQIAAMARLDLIHVTDGAPSTRIARAHGFADAASYHAQRRAELAAAMRLARPGGATHVRQFQLSLPDGRSSFFLAQAATDLASRLRQLRPDVILTHAYEGGHPDHDATAWAVHGARRLLADPPPHWEMTSYHGAGGTLVRNAFIAHPDRPAIPVPLDADAQARKAAMLDCFTSQAAVLRPFPRDAEWFRPAPDYDFRQPPHPGRLLYENRIRALRGAHWRRLAARADRDLRRANALSPLRRATNAAWSFWLTG